MKSLASLLFFCVFAMPASAAVGNARPPTDSQHYRLCLAASSNNPISALADAEDWIKDGGGVPAQHCAALALVGLKRYAQAGARLDKVAADKAVPDASFRSALSDQAGNAWLLAGNGARAVQSFTAALALSGGDADLFADLARAQAMRKNWQEVDLDLNAALQMMPRRADLLILRASARRALKRYPEARADIEAALKIKPGDGGALVERGLLRRQLGDLGGARRDFQAALKTGAAAEAQENLDQLKP
jgi:tetratricopeptide (TPR) repeat protein